MALNRILCATDFSADAASALKRSVILAAEHGAGLRVLHVVAEESLDALRRWVRQPVDLAERIVEAARQELAGCAQAGRDSGVAIEAQVVVGDATQEILKAGAAADLLVLGAHGTNPLKDLILGTTAERLAGTCASPALVVRLPAQAPYSRVLSAVDLLPGSEEVMAAAYALAPKAIHAAVHAYDVPMEGMLQRSGVAQHLIDEQRTQTHREALARIAELSASVCADAGRFLASAERGHPAATVVGRQQAMRADLVVIRKRARGTAEALILGGVTRHVLADVTTDVLLLAQAKR